MTTSYKNPNCQCVKPRTDLSGSLCVECGYKVKPKDPPKPLAVDVVDMSKVAVAEPRVATSERVTREMDPIDLPPSAPKRIEHAAVVLRSLTRPPVKLDDDTPGRWVRAMEEMTSGYGADLKGILKTFPIEGDPGLVAVKDTPFASLCEHHALPFSGTVSVVYLPGDRIVGLSKIPRLIEAVTRRFQVQERIGSEVADAMVDHVGARGVMVVIHGVHSCMALRGVRSSGEMVTSTVRGVFRNDASARAEALSLIHE